MPDNVLTNRLAQPIPEKCPLSEALVWLISGCLPVSLEDYKLINNPSIKTTGAGFDLDLYVTTQHGHQDIIDYDEFLSARNKLLVALTNGTIKACGDYGEFKVRDPIEPERINPQLTSDWNEYYKENYPEVEWEYENKSIPAHLWDMDIVDWFESILHHPIRNDELSQFSNVIVSTEALFKKFGTKDFIHKLKQKEHFLIPASEAVSLISCGEHNGDNTLSYDHFMNKSKEIVRVLRNGDLYSEGHRDTGELEEIAPTSWNSDSDVLKNKSAHHHEVVIDENKVRELFDIPEIDKRGSKITFPPTIPQNKPERRGAPLKYDWETFYTEIIVRSDLDSLPELQADLEKEMAAWCFDKWGKEPSQSTLRRKINNIYNHPRKVRGS